MRYSPEARGDWGHMHGGPEVMIATEQVRAADGCKLFVRVWNADSDDVLLLLHGLGAHSGWFIDFGNELAARGLTVYAMDHRGFGRSEGAPGHIDRAGRYVEDIWCVVSEIRERHPGARVYMLGHSMGGIFATHFAARYGNMLAGVIFLNPWVQDSSRLPVGNTLGIFMGGLFKSKRAWQVAGGPDVMTGNPEAIQMLEADPLWHRTQTATFLVQILRMRLAVPRLAKRITIPALVIQCEQDKAVIPAGTRKLYEALASRDKTWQAYPTYHHNFEFEADRQQLDDDLVAWIHEQASVAGQTVS